MSITKRPFGNLPDGREVDLFTLRSRQGLEVDITPYGGIVTAWRIPSPSGPPTDIVLGHNTLAEYVDSNPYFGCLVGRFSNRIAAGQFTLDGQAYQLTINNAPNHLHGGTRGFDQVLWTAEEVDADSDTPGLRLRYHSPDGEQGYPGHLHVTALYRLTADRSLSLEFQATCEAPTIVNLTQHSYFNLAGEGHASILDHELQIEAEAFLPVSPNLIPTGERTPVEGTPFDFRQFTRIGARIEADHEQLRRGIGYDHNWILSNDRTPLRKVATLRDPQSGRGLEVLTTEPGLQFYSGNFLDGSKTGKSGTAYPFRSGVCLEPQIFPDAPNHPDFPGCVLRPGETYRHALAYRII